MKYFIVLASRSECRREAELDIMLTIPSLQRISDPKTGRYEGTAPARYGDSYNSEKIEKGIHAQVHADILISMVFIRFRPPFKPHRCCFENVS